MRGIVEAMKILSRYGYSVAKQDFTLEELHKLRRELKVQPLSHPDFPPLAPFNVFEETPKYIRLPTWFGISRFGQPDRCVLTDAPVTRLVFTGTLRDYQEEPVRLAVDHLRTKGRGLLCLVTGGGKSISALAVACALRQRTLVVVHKRNLLDQWVEEIAKVAGGARVGIIQQQTMEIGDDYDINIAMWQTLLNRPNLESNWGTVILDECHRVCSKVFSQVMFRINSRHVLGLSATPERADGTTEVLHWHLGEVIYRQPPVLRSTAKTLVWMCAYDESAYAGLGRGGRDFTRVISHICASKKRNELIQKIVQKLLDLPDGSQRSILVLTERVAHAEEIVRLLRLISTRSIGLCVGKVNNKQIQEAMSCDIIVATYKIFEEGTSIETLNTLVFATPKKRITQALGRIFRRAHEISPIVVDIGDSVLRGQQRHRMKIYREETKGHLDFVFYDKHLKDTSESSSSEEEVEVIDEEWTLEADE